MMKNLKFLSELGLFHNADSLVEHKADLEDYKKLITECINDDDYDKAILYAQKASILFGINGLHEYFNTMLLHCEVESKQGEIIDQLLIQLLSYILFAKIKLKDRQAIRFEKQVDALIPCESKDNVYMEAKDICKSIIKSYNLALSLS